MVVGCFIKTYLILNVKYEKGPGTAQQQIPGYLSQLCFTFLSPLKERKKERKKENEIKLEQKIKNVCSGCGAVGRAVASDNRGPGFEPSLRQILLNIYVLLTVCRNDKK